MTSEAYLRRSQVYILNNSGVKDVNKLRKIERCSYGTVRRVIKRINSGECIKRKPGSGRPIKYSANDKRRLSNLANSHPKFSCAQLGKVACVRGNPKVYKTTIFRYLKGSGYKKLMPQKVPFLIEDHMKKRLEWCLKHQNYDWSRVVFTDESFSEITRSKIRMWDKRRPIRMKPHGF